MFDAHEYHALAEEALQAARRAPRAHERTAWLEIAGAWRRLARDTAADFGPTPPPVEPGKRHLRG